MVMQLEYRATLRNVRTNRRFSSTVDRRTMLKSFCAGLGFAQTATSQSTPFRIWDDHCHLGSVPGDTPEERMTALVRWADRLGIERLLLSQGYSAQFHPTPDQFREENDRVMRAVPLTAGSLSPIAWVNSRQ